MTSRAGRRRQRHDARQHRLSQHAHARQVRVVPREPGVVALEIGGVTQSIVAAGDQELGGYWAAMLPEGCPRRALLLGLGGGTVARLLRARCPEVAMVGIERDETVLAVARGELGLDDVGGLRVEIADAMAWVGSEAETNRGGYDYICLDLFEAGRLAPGTLATRFLRQVAALLGPGGSLAVNLMVTGRTPEQLHRLERVYHIVRKVRVRGNLVAHARPLPPDETIADEA